MSSLFLSTFDLSCIFRLQDEEAVSEQATKNAISHISVPVYQFIVPGKDNESLFFFFLRNYFPKPEIIAH